MLSTVLLDDTDAGCPECGAGVSATAVYCLDCGAGARGAASADPPSPGAAVAGSDSAEAPASGAGLDAPSQEDESHGLLHPDGIVDDSLTVGVAGGTVAGVLTLVLLGLAS